MKVLRFIEMVIHFDRMLPAAVPTTEADPLRGSAIVLGILPSTLVVFSGILVAIANATWVFHPEWAAMLAATAPLILIPGGTFWMVRRMYRTYKWFHPTVHSQTDE